VLTDASLMVGGAAAADAVERARRNPGLRVGLHLVVIEGPAALPPDRVPALVGADGWFPSEQFRIGVRYAANSTARQLLAAEIDAQFAAFAATGLTLAHADAHKHMHLHPVVGRLLLRIGRLYGLARVRVPYEPPSVMAALGERPTVGARAMAAWTRWLRIAARRAGVTTDDAVFGLAWSGHMTPERVQRVVRALPAGSSEIYLHPATRRDALLTRLMPEYEHEAELAALLDPGVREAIAAIGA